MCEMVSFYGGTPTPDLHLFLYCLFCSIEQQKFSHVNARSVSNNRYTQCRWQCFDITGRKACYRIPPDKRPLRISTIHQTRAHVPALLAPDEHYPRCCAGLSSRRSGMLTGKLDNVAAFLAFVIDLIGFPPNCRDKMTVEVHTLTKHDGYISARLTGGLHSVQCM